MTAHPRVLVVDARRAPSGSNSRPPLLEQRRIIQLGRKQIVILDREGLKKAANGTYHEPEGG